MSDEIKSKNVFEGKANGKRPPSQKRACRKRLIIVNGTKEDDYI